VAARGAQRDRGGNEQSDDREARRAARSMSPAEGVKRGEIEEAFTGSTAPQL
jgi:hypothetical protein